MNFQGAPEARVNNAPKRKVEKGEGCAFESKRGKQVVRETRVGNFRDNGGRIQRACIISRRVIIMHKANPSYLVVPRGIGIVFISTQSIGVFRFNDIASVSR